MRKGLAVVMLFFIQTVLYASDTPPLVLDKVSLQLTARDWVSTDKALLHINVNMTLNNADMVQARADILKNLKKVAEGEWHITRFDRSQDSSGLEKLYVQAITLLSNLADVKLRGDVYRDGQPRRAAV